MKLQSFAHAQLSGAEMSGKQMEEEKSTKTAETYVASYSRGTVLLSSLFSAQKTRRTESGAINRQWKAMPRLW